MANRAVWPGAIMNSTWIGEWHPQIVRTRSLGEKIQHGWLIHFGSEELSCFSCLITLVRLAVAKMNQLPERSLLLFWYSIVVDTRIYFMCMTFWVNKEFFSINQSINQSITERYINVNLENVEMKSSRNKVWLSHAADPCMTPKIMHDVCQQHYEMWKWTRKLLFFG